MHTAGSDPGSHLAVKAWLLAAVASMTCSKRGQGCHFSTHPARLQVEARRIQSSPIMHVIFDARATEPMLMSGTVLAFIIAQSLQHGQVKEHVTKAASRVF